MTSDVIQGGDWAENIAKLLGSHYPDVPDKTLDITLATCSDVESSVDSNKCSENHQVTFAEIFNHTLPSSPKIIEFNSTIEHIWTIKQGTSLVDRDDAKISEAIFLMSDILDIYWNEFPTKTKVLLLDKLQIFNKSGWQFMLKLISQLPKTLKDVSFRYATYISEYNSLNRSTQEHLKQTAYTNSTSLIKSIWYLCNVVRKMLKKDGKLLKENQANIQNFTVDILSLIRQNSKNDAFQVNDEKVIHSFNCKGEPFSYNIKDLFWNPKAYDYIKEQEEIFGLCFPKLIKEYPDRYVIFENSEVIDSDSDEITLLGRISKNESYKDRPAIFCKLVPKNPKMNKVNA
jgi:hypothetical protein